MRMVSSISSHIQQSILIENYGFTGLFWLGKSGAKELAGRTGARHEAGVIMFDLCVHAHHFSLLATTPPDKDSAGFAPTAGYDAPCPCAGTCLVKSDVDILRTQSLLAFVRLRSPASFLRDRWEVRVSGTDGFMAEDVFKNYKVCIALSLSLISHACLRQACIREWISTHERLDLGSA